MNYIQSARNMPGFTIPNSDGRHTERLNQTRNFIGKCLLNLAPLETSNTKALRSICHKVSYMCGDRHAFGNGTHVTLQSRQAHILGLMAPNPSRRTCHMAHRSNVKFQEDAILTCLHGEYFL